MATSYKKKGAKTNKKSKSKSRLNDQDPPIIIRPGTGLLRRTPAGLIVIVQNLNATSGNTLGSPRPNGNDFLYAHNKNAFTLKSVSLVTSTGTTIAKFEPDDWSDFEVKVDYSR